MRMITKFFQAGVRLLGILFIIMAAKSDAEEGALPVGVIVPLSGPLAPYGKGCLDGMKMRIEEANEAGGVGGKKIRLIVEDNKGDRSETIQAYRKLVGKDGVIAVMGPVTSTNTLALRREAAQAKVPVITPTATNDKVTERNSYMFRSCFKDSFQGEVIANYVAKTLGLRKAATLTDKNSDYSVGLTNAFRTAFEAAGGHVVAAEGYRQKDTAFGAQLKAIVDSGAEVLFVPGYPPEVPLIIKEAKVVGFQGRLCGADGWDQAAVLQGSGDAIVGAFLTAMFSPDDQREIVQRFVAKATEKLGEKPGTFQAQGYDTASLLLRAMETGTTPDKIVEGLLSIQNFEAVTGSITMTPEGDAIKAAVILEVTKLEDGTYGTRYVATVSP